MIDARLLRTDLAATSDALARRGKPVLVEQLTAAADLDTRLREITSGRDSVRARVNELSKEIARLRRDPNGDSGAVEALATESRSLGEQERQLADEHDAVSAQLRTTLLGIPNLPHEDAPDGKTDADNPVVKGPVGPCTPDDFAEWQKVPHWEIGAELGILDNERAIKISGAMFSLTRGLGATLARALCQLALDRNADAFEEVRPPSLVTTATLTATGHLPKFADDVFAVERDGLWAIPTAEVPLTSLYGGEILALAELPKRLMAYTPCYRREAGSAGRDTRGLLRSHEFDKVEILALATPDQSPALLDELVARAEAIVVALALPYRIIEICTGDLGQSHHRSFDIEVYSPGTDSWLEVSSISWFSDYQGRRANIRYRTADGGKGTSIVHTLNGSALAVPRIWAAIVEHYRQADGSVVIPEVLRVYMRGAEVIAPRAS